MAISTVEHPFCKVTFMLDESTGLSDSAQLTDPTGTAVTARIVTTNVAGTLMLVDIAGNATDHVLAAGESVAGFFNGIKTTGTVTITAADISILA